MAFLSDVCIVQKSELKGNLHLSKYFVIILNMTNSKFRLKKNEILRNRRVVEMFLIFKNLCIAQPKKFIKGNKNNKVIKLTSLSHFVPFYVHYLERRDRICSHRTGPHIRPPETYQVTKIILKTTHY